ncbi:hypothetical protein GobsT_30750 [Gemmata obscuriglobus]|uniref:Uncharacterized protein n=1 Tax=Gemmata obscuriglobus TaxID=114 RepID=A0A2Z3H1K8_9BACT|nr:hypothetical protein [Gemmata obscuriglobus]AWM38731.1 hypothetical protein C1280_18200 [Gemmata obscuriglobus]QEG28298.1 hypothetical protein GobsT_30750 [Gemmata obscuriglobus]VTS06131.1 unnamed protein product [Gemmata obscuriglobus UQM 2246]VTS08163.1 unnamed protein product [Gemmata obscuriglobus UQM 2246]
MSATNALAYEAGLTSPGPDDVTGGRATTVAFVSPQMRKAVFDCRYGRRLTVIVPRSASAAFVHLDDPDRTSDFLGWRDNPSLTLEAEDPALVRFCRLCVEGSISPNDLSYYFEHRCPVVSESGWRRTLLHEWCSNARPVDPVSALAVELNATGTM